MRAGHAHTRAGGEVGYASEEVGADAVSRWQAALHADAPDCLWSREPLALMCDAYGQGRARGDLVVDP